MTSRTLTLEAEVPSGPAEGPGEASVEDCLLVIPQNCLVQGVGPTGSLVQGLQDQLPRKDAELEEKDSSGSLGNPALTPAWGRKEEALSEEEREHLWGINGLLGCQIHREVIKPKAPQCEGGVWGTGMAL